MSTKEYHQEWYKKNKERIRERQAQYYAQNRERVRALQKAAYLRRCEADPTYHERMRERDRQSKLRRIVADRAYQKTRWDRMRRDVMTFVGGQYGLQCRKCGYDDYRALQIDHVQGGGRAEIRKFRDNHKYLEHIRQNPANYQILCANCNWLKRHEENELTKKKGASETVDYQRSEAQTATLVAL